MYKVYTVILSAVNILIDLINILNMPDNADIRPKDYVFCSP